MAWYELTSGLLTSSLCLSGCMESLVHYQSILLRRHALPSDSLVKECLNLLGQLKSIDPARRQRYEEIGELRGSEFSRR